MTSIVLSDGRTLGFAEYGDLYGKPVFFFHGSPGSRFFRPPDRITSNLGVHLICADRPGYGLSTFQPGRCLLDWADDIHLLADKLGIDKFAVTGHSGGGPYVLACAFALSTRVRKAVVLCGAGPLDAHGADEGLSGTNKFGLWVGRFLPWPLWRMLVWILYHRRAADPAAEMDRGNGHRPSADDEQMRNPEVREACIQSEREAFRLGLSGLAWELRLLTRPWSFRLEEIKIPVTLWHGSQDDQVTTAMTHTMAAQIPGSKTISCDHEAHLLLFPHWQEILKSLTSE